MAENALAWLSIAAGLVVLVVGAELLVRGASRLAVAMRISPLVIGLTVVAYGTSAPELAVSVQAGVRGSAELALGNVVGSNIFNVLFILGASALIVPLAVSSQLIRRDVPVMIAVSILVAIMGVDGRIGRWEGCLLFAGVMGYSWWSVRQSRRENAAVQAEFRQELPKSVGLATNLVTIVGGLLALMGGSRLLIEGSVIVASSLGVSELVIGLTLVAAGTSMPELVTSVVAALRGERDIAVGNVIGSNIFNLLCVLGLSATVSPQGLDVGRTALLFDIPVMVAVAAACLPIFFTGHVISRWEGGLFFFYYLAYVTHLVLQATGSGWVEPLRDMMLLFVVPLTMVTLVIAVWRYRSSRRLPGRRDERRTGNECVMNELQHLLFHVLIQLAVIVTAARIGAWVFAKFGQPQVVGEIIAGLVLGPSLLGRIAPAHWSSSSPPMRHWCSACSVNWGSCC